MIHLTERDVEAALARMQKIHHRVNEMTATGEDVMGAAVGQALSAVTTFGSGYAIGRWGPIKVGPVEADLLGAGALHLGAFFGLFGKMSNAAHSVAQGLGDGYVHRCGVGLGSAHRTTPAAVASGRSPMHVGGPTRHAAIPSRKPVTQAEVVSLMSRPAR